MELLIHRLIANNTIFARQTKNVKIFEYNVIVLKMYILMKLCMFKYVNMSMCSFRIVLQINFHSHICLFFILFM